MLPAQANQSLMDGIEVLQGVIGRRDAVGSRELARELGMESSRVNRLLKTLAHMGLTRQDNQRRYRPGPGVHALAAQAVIGSGLLQRALGPLQGLHQHGLIVAMGMLWRDQVSYLYHAEPGMAAEHAVGRMGLFPARESAIGLALMARRDNPEQVPAALREDVRAVQANGYALVPIGSGTLRSLGVSVPGDDGVAIALSGNITKRQAPALFRAVRHAADAIAAAEDRIPNGHT